MRPLDSPSVAGRMIDRSVKSARSQNFADAIACARALARSKSTGGSCMAGRRFSAFFSGLAAATLASAAAFAADVKPAVIYDLGGKFDKSFNEGVFNGATKFSKETGVAFRDLEIQSDAQREQVLRKFAKDGFSPIMTVGFAWSTALKKVAAEFPDTKFGIIDDIVDLPNVQSIKF